MSTTFGKKRQKAAEAAWLMAFEKVAKESRKVSEEFDLKSLHEQANATISGNTATNKNTGETYTAVQVKEARAALRALEISKGNTPEEIDWSHKGFGIIRNSIKDTGEEVTVPARGPGGATKAETPLAAEENVNKIVKRLAEGLFAGKGPIDVRKGAAKRHTKKVTPVPDLTPPTPAPAPEKVVRTSPFRQPGPMANAQLPPVTILSGLKRGGPQKPGSSMPRTPEVGDLFGSWLFKSHGTSRSAEKPAPKPTKSTKPRKPPKKPSAWR
jgi:hypothetical protein